MFDHCRFLIATSLPSTS